MRSEIGKLTLDQTLSNREHLNIKIIESIKPVAEEWGIKMLRYEIKDIEPPANIRDSMILQAEAEIKSPSCCRRGEIRRERPSRQRQCYRDNS